MPRFVILEHDHPRLHWDFMVESDGVLRAWRLPAPPAAAGSDLPAEPLGDHRLAYLDYEGPVSGNRGAVTRWDWGEYESRTTVPGANSVLFVKGQRLAGTVILARIGEGGWQFSYRPASGGAEVT